MAPTLSSMHNGWSRHCEREYHMHKEHKGLDVVHDAHWNKYPRQLKRSGGSRTRFYVSDRKKAKIKSESKHISPPAFSYTPGQSCLIISASGGSTFWPSSVPHMGTINVNLGAILNFESHKRIKLSSTFLPLFHSHNKMCSRLLTNRAQTHGTIAGDSLSASYKSLRWWMAYRPCTR